MIAFARFPRARWCLPFCFSLVACGSDDGDQNFEISSGVLSGTVGGESWSLARAETDAFLSDDAEFWADFYADSPGTSCSGSRNTERHHILVTVPRQPGRYPLSLSLNATFVIEGPTGTLENLVAASGVIEVESLSDTSVQGGAHIEFDGDNVVNGRFDLTVCP